MLIFSLTISVFMNRSALERLRGWTLLCKKISKIKEEKRILSEVSSTNQSENFLLLTSDFWAQELYLTEYRRLSSELEYQLFTKLWVWLPSKFHTISTYCNPLCWWRNWTVVRSCDYQNEIIKNENWLAWIKSIAMVTYYNVSEPWRLHAKWNKEVAGRQTLDDSTYMRYLK